VTLRIAFPGGRESSDIYGKVTRVEPADGGTLSRIHFTSMTEADGKIVETLATAPAAI
jgi:hypothetical protein